MDTKERNVAVRRRKSAKKKHPALKRAGVSGFNKPKRTPGHPKKSHIVVAKVGKTVKKIFYCSFTLLDHSFNWIASILFNFLCKFYFFS